MNSQQLAKRSAVLAAIATATIAPSYEFAVCKHASIVSAIVVVATLLMPGFIFWVAKYYWGVVVACIAMLLPALWAYRAECVLPYTGGGAKMAFLEVFFVGVPAAFVLGAIVGWIGKEFDAG